MSCWERCCEVRRLEEIVPKKEEIKLEEPVISPDGKVEEQRKLQEQKEAKDREEKNQEALIKANQTRLQDARQKLNEALAVLAELEPKWQPNHLQVIPNQTLPMTTSK